MNHPLSRHDDPPDRHPRQPPGPLAGRAGSPTAFAALPSRSGRRARRDQDPRATATGVSPLAAIGGTGLFTKEIQRAVLDRTVDVAVHSLKDLPTQGPEELTLAAVPPREDVADALIAPVHRTLRLAPAGARVGTGSLRRRAQLLHLRADLDVVTIRGNVETRLNQALEGKLDAVMLAWAGLHRLGLEHHVTERLEPPRFLPAVGQGALGIECRGDDAAPARAPAAARRPGHPPRRRGRARALAELEGGCMIPMAAWARDVETADEAGRAGLLALDAAVFDPDGRERIFAAETGPLDAPRILASASLGPFAPRGPNLCSGGPGSGQAEREQPVASGSPASTIEIGQSTRLSPAHPSQLTLGPQVTK